MEAVVITRKLDADETNTLLKKVKTGEIKLFASVELPDVLKSYSSLLPEVADDKKKEINYRIMKKVLAFGDMEIEGKSVTEHLMIEKAGIWHYHKFRIYFLVRNRIYHAEQIEQLVGKYRRIDLYTSEYWMKQYVEGKDDITLHLPDQAKAKAKAKGNLYTLVSYGFFFVLRSMIGIFQSTGIRNKKHILIDHAIRQNCLDLETLKPVKGNTYMKYLFDKVGHDFLILDDREMPRMKSNQKFSFRGGEFTMGSGRLFGEYVLLKGVLSSGLRKKLRKKTRNLEQKYELIQGHLRTNPDRLIFNELISLHTTSRLYLFKYLAYRRFFAKKMFLSVTSIDENSARIKTILDAAKSRDMITIGIQHGTIHELHPAYLFTKKDIELNVIPDYTLVWGEYWAKFLQEKGNYPKNSLVITGQIRSDIIPRLKEDDQENFAGSTGKGRRVVFASQPQRDPVIRERAAFDVFTAVKALVDVELIVKLHPAEKNDADYYRRIAAKAGCSNYRIILKVDLYLLISQCEVMITCFSTVGAETVYFNKPLIILDHLKQDIQGYHREGIALQAANAKELRNYLEDFLTGKRRIDEQAYREYIEKYAFKIDGKVSKRIREFIEQC